MNASTNVQESLATGQARGRSTSQLDLSLIITTYQRPRNLERVLASVLTQRNMKDRFEVVIADDGSTDNTREIVDRFIKTAPFPVSFVTHPHGGFQAALTRNEGAAASRAPYLVFLDGDCLIPPDHLEKQLRCRRPGWAMGGHAIYLDEATAEEITPPWVASGECGRLASIRNKLDLWRHSLKARLHTAIGHPTKPKLFTLNIALWRSDLERINGFDENFVGWGGEDDDLNLRLRRAGVRIGSVIHTTHVYHLWHPPVASKPPSLQEGLNFKYLNRTDRLISCRRGLKKRSLAELDVQLVGNPNDAEAAALLLETFFGKELPASDPAIKHGKSEVEVLLRPGSGKFSTRSQCNVLLALDRGAVCEHDLRHAHVIVVDGPFYERVHARQFTLNQIEAALASIA